MFIFFKMLLFQLFPSSSFFFPTKKATVNSTFHSAAPFSGDGSCCISWKMILRWRLKVTVRGLCVNSDSFYQRLTLFFSSLFSSMSRLNFCCRSASSMRRASASTGSGPVVPRWSLMKLRRWLKWTWALNIQSTEIFHFNHARWPKLGKDTIKQQCSFLGPSM